MSEIFEIQEDVFTVSVLNLDNGSIIYPGTYLSKGTRIDSDTLVYPNCFIFPCVEIGKNVTIFPGATLGKLATSAGATARKTSSEYKLLKIGDNSVISPNAVLYSDVVIGENTLIGDNASIREECKIGDYCIISRNVSINYNTIIGNHTKIMDNSHITGNMIIEDYVFISALVVTTNDNNIGKNGYSEEEIKGPVIKTGAMIGAGANLLPKVIIGEYSIVGAGALITKNIPEKVLAKGIPAQIFELKNNFLNS